jgi:hypothetical protein
MFDTGFSLSLEAVSHQLAAMSAKTYLIRLIHFQSRRPFPGERLWTASQIVDESTLRFLRARNREGFDVYFRPYSDHQNAGFILVDLDEAPPSVLAIMRANGHEPCVAVQTSPGHFQAWIRVSESSLPPAVATQIARRLAQLYHGDRASADWRHIGRLAGFTNRKPQRRLPSGWPPWVRLQFAQPCLASNRSALIDAASCPAPPATLGRIRSSVAIPSQANVHDHAFGSCVATAVALYQTCLMELQIPQRFSCPDWSIADLWIAKALLQRGMPEAAVKSMLHLASPGFPRSHSDPEDYLRRTLARAVRDMLASHSAPFPARPVASSAGCPPRAARLCAVSSNAIEHR